ncbi:hypothetical protein PHMEG_00015901 [Phytophthora megakarya]|uniref:Uncharacterized protein n=1 Tax=Phytophthora megakarya TaxID=4795 RepID=A0A225W0K6_9STRA|nr:hypothetical protein PHMEG_00015901 [Phytophthora megakarya]
MSLQDLAPVNSQRAQQTAINAFSRFLMAEGVSMSIRVKVAHIVDIRGVSGTCTVLRLPRQATHQLDGTTTLF